MTLHELNHSDDAEVLRALLACCGSSRWAQTIMSRRPFETLAQIHAAAQDIWWSLDEADWRQAFAAHPKIGETKPVSRWSSEEQKGMSVAAVDTAAAIAALNSDYEERFGYIFIVCATGKSAAEMRTLLEGRLKNNLEEELRIAASEQMKITHLRLDKLLRS